MLTNKIMQSHTTLILEIKLLLDDKGMRLYCNPNPYIIYSEKGLFFFTAT